jgi:rRNA-processing protein FCF1
MLGDDEIKAMEAAIEEMQSNLRNAREAAADLKYSKLREVVTARKEADEAVRKELDKLGYTMYFRNPFTL